MCAGCSISASVWTEFLGVSENHGAHASHAWTWSVRYIFNFSSTRRRANGGFASHPRRRSRRISTPSPTTVLDHFAPLRSWTNHSIHRAIASRRENNPNPTTHSLRRIEGNVFDPSAAAARLATASTSTTRSPRSPSWSLILGTSTSTAAWLQTSSRPCSSKATRKEAEMASQSAPTLRREAPRRICGDTEGRYAARALAQDC